MQMEQQQALMEQKQMAMEKAQEARFKAAEAAQEARHTDMLNKIELMTAARTHAQKIKQGDEAHQQKMTQAKEKAEHDRKQRAVAGVEKK